MDFSPMSTDEARAFMAQQPSGRSFTLGPADTRRYVEADMVLKGFGPEEIRMALERL